MSHPLLSRSDDLRRLVEDGYDVRIQDSYLIVDRVPYVNQHHKVAYGALVTVLTLAGEADLGPQGDHTVSFTGTQPYASTGVPLEILAGSEEKVITEGVIQPNLIFLTLQNVGDNFEHTLLQVVVHKSPARTGKGRREE